MLVTAPSSPHHLAAAVTRPRTALRDMDGTCTESSLVWREAETDLTRTQAPSRPRQLDSSLRGLRPSGVPAERTVVIEGSLRAGGGS
jgi:hypothetical protein